MHERIGAERCGIARELFDMRADERHVEGSHERIAPVQFGERTKQGRRRPHSRIETARVDETHRPVAIT
jgi:hypothetical protein